VTTICGTNARSASTVGSVFSSILTIRWVGRNARIASICTDFVPPTFGTLCTFSRGCTQKPVRPTICASSPSANSNSVMLGTSDTMRASAPAGACSTPAASVTCSLMAGPDSLGRCRRRLPYSVPARGLCGAFFIAAS
jgi:hypothetical protein